jgi:cytochrome c-type biogenesis protein CcmH/NrfG
MNPTSTFAKRRYSSAQIGKEFARGGADSGTAAYRDLKSRYGPGVVNEMTLNEVGHRLLADHSVPAAIAAFQLNVTENPASADALATLGEAYVAKGDKRLAKQSFTKALAIDPTNEDALQGLKDLGAAPSKGTKGK